MILVGVVRVDFGVAVEAIFMVFNIIALGRLQAFISVGRCKTDKVIMRTVAISTTPSSISSIGMFRTNPDYASTTERK